MDNSTLGMHSLNRILGHSPLVVCGDFDNKLATADRRDASRENTLLRQLAGSWELPGRQCRRLICGNTSGLFWCKVRGFPPREEKETLIQANQENKDPVRVSGVKIAAMVQAVLDQCCRRSGRFGEHHAQSGMVWFDTPARVNAIVSYTSTSSPRQVLILCVHAAAALFNDPFC